MLLIQPGEPLNEQELRNSAYTGAWLSDAKQRFSMKQDVELL